MRIRCPACHAEYSIDQAVEDEAARELMGVLADLPRECGRPLTAYLGLFRSATRALAWERALRLAREVLALHADRHLLGAAVSETVEAMRKRQDTGPWKPLSNHNYLQRVLESFAARGVELVRVDPVTPAAKPADRTTSRMLARYEGICDD